MCTRLASRSETPLFPVVSRLLFISGLVGLNSLIPPAIAETREATEFSVPAGLPDEYMRAGAAFARELEPGLDISFWDSQSGSLSVSRVEGNRVKCIVRASPVLSEALRPLGRFLNGRIDPQVQAMFALAHEVGHCKLHGAFLQRPDGSAADASVFPWLAQEAAADTYGILSVERQLGNDVPVRQAVVLSRMLSSAIYRDPNHATGHYVSTSLSLCRRNRTDDDALECALATAYYTAGSLANDERASPYPSDSGPELFYELGLRKVAQAMRVYQDIAQYKASFSGADLSRFAFNEISRHGDSRYITAIGSQQTDSTYGLADYYGFKTGRLVTEDHRNVTALRIDGEDELDWLLTLGAVVRTADGQYLRKGDSRY